ncbi:uncharacterized protein LOC129218212 [Uloborus diversus]|uniref:uncharacterized protein LOC129218212 n=1 Tax=Uloborus diversus TaxID=327109 RepID=UPI002408F824|nr:uncharacterized protein LOC129218212 [Uloborus diversus]
MNRSQNYSAAELDALISALEKKRFLVSGELGPLCETIQAQKNAWDEVAEVVSSRAMGVTRTGYQIKNKWCDLKYRIRCKAVRMKEEREKTGGGRGQTVKLTLQEERVLGLLGEAYISGIVGEELDTSYDLEPEQSNGYLETLAGPSMTNSSLADVETEVDTVERTSAGPPRRILSTPQGVKRKIEKPGSSIQRVQEYRNKKRTQMINWEEDEDTQVLTTQKETNENIKK